MRNQVYTRLSSSALTLEMRIGSENRKQGCPHRLLGDAARDLLALEGAVAPTVEVEKQVAAARRVEQLVGVRRRRAQLHVDVDEGVDVGGDPPFRCVRCRVASGRQVECPAAPLRRQLCLALAAPKLAALREELVPDEAPVDDGRRRLRRCAAPSRNEGASDTVSIITPSAVIILTISGSTGLVVNYDCTDASGEVEQCAITIRWWTMLLPQLALLMVASFGTKHAQAALRLARLAGHRAGA